MQGWGGWRGTCPETPLHVATPPPRPGSVDSCSQCGAAAHGLKGSSEGLALEG